MKILKELIPYIIVILAVIVIRNFIVTPVMVSGSSMDPTLENNQILILKKYDRSYERFDIVVIDFASNAFNERLIKRVIGLPGEEIKYVDNKLYVNGKELDDEFAPITDDFDTNKFGSKTIPEGKYLVLGDNRTNSMDSRMLGFIDKSDIKGIVDLRVFPFNRMGTIK